MTRQPLLRKHPNSGIEFGAGFLEKRPKAASFIAQCIAGWTEVELQVARLLAVMLKANTEPAIALYLTLANERAKREALDSIADYVFNAADRKLYDAIFQSKAAIANDRNDLAHGVFGVASDEPDGVAWISTKNRIKNMVFTQSHQNVELADYLKIKEYVFIYTLNDLSSILDNIADLHRVIYMFISYLGRDSTDPSSVELRQQLSNGGLSR